MDERVELSQNTPLRWIVEGHILAIEIKANTQHLMHIYDDQAMLLLEASPRVIDVIIVPPPDENKPPALRQMIGLKSFHHARLGYVIITRAYEDPVLRFLMQVISRLTNLKIKGVDTVDDGVLFLRTIRNL